MFAFGSREGLHNSVSMGVVSSVARQFDADSPFIYIQTDAAINPGDSGGPLVNSAGEIVGLDTLILSNSGGSEGLGFAIPSTLVQLAAAELKEHGHFHRNLVGVGVQSIKPDLSAALKLSQSSGVLVSDVLPGGPADKAGLCLDDIIIAADGRAIRNLPFFMMTMLTTRGGTPLELTVLRAGRRLPIQLIPIEETDESDALSEIIHSAGTDVAELGVIGIDISSRVTAALPDLRLAEGVYIAGWSNPSGRRAAELLLGDVIHRVNGAPISSSSDLVRNLRQAKRGDPVALWIERDRKLQYIAFEFE